MVRLLTARRAALVLPLLGALLLVATSCGGGGGGDAGKDPDEDDLVAISFSHAERTDVYRNQPVTITFNVPVKKSTVSDRTIQVRTGPNLKTVAMGRFHVDGNQVVFDPRQVQQDLRTQTIIGPHPFGYNPLATYQVLVLGPPTPAVKMVKSKAGKKVVQEFFATFRTIDEYMPELTQPRYTGDIYEGDDASILTAYGTGAVDITVEGDASLWHETDLSQTGDGDHDVTGYVNNRTTGELMRYGSITVEPDPSDSSGESKLSTLHVPEDGREISRGSDVSEGPGLPGSAGQTLEETAISTLVFLPLQNPDRRVRQDSLLILVFDEPIDPASVDPGTTVIVRNETLTQQFGTEILVPGTASYDASATRWTFESSFGFGQGPYDMSVTLRPGVEDLAGNPLGNPTVADFRTSLDLNVPNSNIITEPFTRTTKWDRNATPANLRADWDGSRNGWLLGGAITTVVVPIRLLPSQPGLGGGSRTRINSPLTDISPGSHTQCLYMQEEVGEAGTIASAGWGPDSDALFAATHDRIILKFGQFSAENLTSTYVDNFNIGAPVRVYDGPYSIPQKANISEPNENPVDLTDDFWPWPTFSAYFEYDGVNNLVFDMDVVEGTNFQIHRVYYGLSFSNPAISTIPNRRLYGPFGAEEGPPPTFQPPGNPEPTVYDMEFTKRRRITIAQSFWYNSFVNNANYGTPILSPPTQPGGATFVLEWDGAKGMPHPLNPGLIVVDESTSTGFVENIDILDGYRFIRFRFTLIANLISDTVPEINSLTIPYFF